MKRWDPSSLYFVRLKLALQALHTLQLWLFRTAPRVVRPRLELDGNPPGSPPEKDHLRVLIATLPYFPGSSTGPRERLFTSINPFTSVNLVNNLIPSIYSFLTTSIQAAICYFWNLGLTTHLIALLDLCSLVFLLKL